MIGRVFLFFAIVGLTILPGQELFGQADIYSYAFMTFDQENDELYGLAAVSATYDVLFYYQVATETSLFTKDGKIEDISSANSIDDEYVFAEVQCPANPGTAYIISGKVATGPWYKRNQDEYYDVFNFHYWAAHPVSRRNYAHFNGKGPVYYMKRSEEDPLDLFGRTTEMGKLAINVQKGRLCKDGGCVVFDPARKDPVTTSLTGVGMTQPGTYRWFLGPKLALIGSPSDPKIRVQGVSLSSTKGDTTVTLVFTPQGGDEQTTSIRFTIREPMSLASLWERR